MTMMFKERASKSLSAMGNPVRIEIAFLIGMQGRLNAGQIAEHFKISRPAISSHLRVLREAQILIAEKTGKEIYYSLDRKSIEDTLNVILDMVRKSANQSCTQRGEKA